MANDTDGLVLALAIDGLQLGDDSLKAIGRALLDLIRYHDRKMKTMQTHTLGYNQFTLVAIYNVAMMLAERSSIGLGFVPAIAEKFPELTVRDFQNHLLQLDRSDLIELRPDSESYQTISDAHLEVCPRALDNSALAWVRIRKDDD